MTGYLFHIEQAYILICCIMTGGRKVFRMLPSSRAKKLTAGKICLMADETLPLEMTLFQKVTMRSSHSCIICKTRTRSGWISCRPERLGIGTE